MCSPHWAGGKERYIMGILLLKDYHLIAHSSTISHLCLPLSTAPRLQFPRWPEVKEQDRKASNLSDPRPVIFGGHVRASPYYARLSPGISRFGPVWDLHGAAHTEPVLVLHGAAHMEPVWDSTGPAHTKPIWDMAEPAHAGPAQDLTGLDWEPGTRFTDAH